MVGNDTQDGPLEAGRVYMDNWSEGLYSSGLAE